MNWITGALVAAAFAAGFTVSDWRDQGTIERLRGKVETARKNCVSDKLAAEREARRFLESENARLERQARREHSRAEALRLMLRDLSIRAAKFEEDLNHALAQTDLRRCDARRPARLLRDKAQRYRRQLAELQTHGRGADGAGATRAGDAPQGK